MTEREKQRIETLRAKRDEAHDKAISLQTAIFAQLQAGQLVGVLAVQYDEALTKFRVYSEELYEATKT
jgi:hypothetical protein